MSFQKSNDYDHNYDDVYDYHIKIILSRCLLFFYSKSMWLHFFQIFQALYKQPKTMSKEKKKQTYMITKCCSTWDPFGIQLSHPDLGPTTLVWVRPMDPMDRAPDLVGRQAPTTLPRFMAAWDDRIWRFLTTGVRGGKISRIHGFTSNKEFKWNDNHWDMVDIGVLLDFCLSFPHMVFFQTAKYSSEIASW